ncbi:unnamed protein product [Closterium sp. NIES-65]|nr:unnamed protein product [Closterium sp. NIES-65]
MAQGASARRWRKGQVQGDGARGKCKAMAQGASARRWRKGQVQGDGARGKCKAMAQGASARRWRKGQVQGDDGRVCELVRVSAGREETAGGVAQQVLRDQGVALGAGGTASLVFNGVECGGYEGNSRWCWQEETAAGVAQEVLRDQGVALAAGGTASLVFNGVEVRALKAG